MSVTISAKTKTMFGSSLPPIVCRRAHVLFTLLLHLLALNSVQHTLCCVCFWGGSVFVRCPVYHMMPVSLDYPFLIASLVYSNVYSQLVTPVVCVTVLSIYLPLLITINGCFSRQSPYVYICNVLEVLNIAHVGFPF